MPNKLVLCGLALVKWTPDSGIIPQGGVPWNEKVSIEVVAENSK
jgi:hypothetical protein